MKQVRIVTDSTADIPDDLAQELGITEIPCLVHFGRETYRDGVDLSPEAFYRKLANAAEWPRTSQPAISEFVETYHRLLDDGGCSGIVSIHVAGSMSGTLNAAWAAAQELPEPSSVTVVDSGVVSMGMGWVVVEAARLAQKGATLAEIGQATLALLDRSRTAAMIDTLEGLYQGGRISQISALLGTALQIKPLLSIHGGEVAVWGKVRTRARALKRLAAHVREWGPLSEMAVLHADGEKLAKSLLDDLQDLISVGRVILSPAGAAVTAHLGVGAVGVCALTALESE